MKHLTFLFFILLIGRLSFAQQNRFDGGIEGGPSLISLWGNETISTYNKSTIGYSAGLFLQYSFPKLISFRTGIYYERKGTASNRSILAADGSVIIFVPTRSNFD